MPQRAGIVDVLGQHLAASTSLWLSRRHLRVIAYHDVPDPDAFGAQLDWLTERCVPVSEAQVISALDGECALPQRAVWITFDDGYPDVIERALPRLVDAQVPATLMVCPALVDTTACYWWQIVEAEGDDPARLKVLPDAERRQRVQALELRYRQRHGDRPQRAQLTSGQLRRWVRSGLTVGNHTWDHPLLDRCEASEQRRQIRLAHEKLTEMVGEQPRSFAYPNGNWTAAAEQELIRLGYACALGFDHRLTRLPVANPMRLSRLRLDTQASAGRARAIVSGLHPTLLRLKQRAGGILSQRDDPRVLPR